MQFKGKRKARNQEPEEPGAKRQRHCDWYDTPITEAERGLANLEKDRKNWATNLNKWQTKHEPVFQEMKKKYAHVVQSMTVDLLAPVSKEQKSKVYENADNDEAPTFGGTAGRLFFKFILPIELYISRYYVSAIMHLIGFPSAGCVDLINDYYGPVIEIVVYAVVDEYHADAHVRDVYLSWDPEVTNDKTIERADKFHKIFAARICYGSIFFTGPR